MEQRCNIMLRVRTDDNQLVVRIAVSSFLQTLPGCFKRTCHIEVQLFSSSQAKQAFTYTAAII